MPAVEKCHGKQANPGKVLHAHQGLFAEPSAPARHAVAERAEPQIRAQRHAGDERSFGSDAVLHPFVEVNQAECDMK